MEWLCHVVPVSFSIKDHDLAEFIADEVDKKIQSKMKEKMMS